MGHGAGCRMGSKNKARQYRVIKTGLSINIIFQKMLFRLSSEHCRYFKLSEIICFMNLSSAYFLRSRQGIGIKLQNQDIIALSYPVI
jgi:hypothetical protein